MIDIENFIYLNIRSISYRMDNLFSVHISKYPAILLIDASGSVIYNKYNNIRILDQIENIIHSLPEESFRVIFWNSDQPRGLKTDFDSGVYIVPFIVRKKSISQIFTIVAGKIDNNCVTFPHIGFKNIPKEWLNECSQVYFITDGEMGYTGITLYDKTNLKKQLSDAIKNVITSDKNLAVITVEQKDIDFTKMEMLTSAAGCDVYSVIMNNNLTNIITKFISYTPENINGFVHINKNKAPSGYVPFGDKYFHETRTDEFISYIRDLIKAENNADKLLMILQSLSSTIVKLAQDKPKNIIDNIIGNFCKLFKGTDIDTVLAQFILTDAVEKETKGTAEIFAAYRANLRDLFKQAETLLNRCVRTAIGLNNRFMTLPTCGMVISGVYRLIDSNIYGYSRGGVKINNCILPVICMDYTDGSPISEQCIRQWVRIIVSKAYNVGYSDDIVIYIVLAIIGMVVSSDIDNELKESYRRLGHIMLGKKRTNSMQTELERLETGELPIPNNGKLDQFYKFMNYINTKFKLNLRPFSTWYTLCLALGNKKIIQGQKHHCEVDLQKDFGDNYDAGLLLFEKITHVSIPLEAVLDYNCLITMENVENIGGWRFLPHSDGVNICSPIYVLSDEGYNQLVKAPATSMCPICYTKLSLDNFAKVGPKVIPDIKLSTGNKGTVIVMKGVVGAGKSTYSDAIKSKIEARGGKCIIEGTDKYCKNGKSVKVAIGIIKKSLQSAVESNEPSVVIIDTCGEGATGISFFDINFIGWNIKEVWPNLNKSNLQGYLAWTLKNVLSRDDPKGNYYLRPGTAGKDTCISVHKRKAMALFGNDVAIPEDIDKLAAEYANELPMIDVVVDEIVDSLYKN